ncbi:MAG: helix-turn-helix domain-containing protein [Phycisphaerales bacterium]
MSSVRPCLVLPHHGEPSPVDLRHLLRQLPDDLGGQVLDFVSWRGGALTTGGRRLLYHTFQAAQNLTSVSGLARSLGVSRRALGRRFAEETLPAPSRCLQAGRILLVHLRATSTSGSLASVARDMGYPDPFSMSNQMKRIAGVRPAEARKRLGWEWLVESWLRREERRSARRRATLALSIDEERGEP